MHRPISILSLAVLILIGLIFVSATISSSVVAGSDVEEQLQHIVSPHHPPAHPTPVRPRRRVSPIDLRPIIGIFSLANSDDPEETGSIIPADYVKFLEQAGARVAVIPFNAPQNVLDQIFAGINGILFTGGGLSLGADTLFFQQATYLFNKAMAANDGGDVFPIWGSCQGFQMMNLLASQPANHADVLKCNIYNSTNLVLPLNFTEAAINSQLFGPAQYIPAVWDGASMHPTIYETFATQAITQNLHNCGVNPADFNANPILPTFYKVLSTNVDLNGLPFVSTIEGFQYPFFGAQWHAERTQFEWDIQEKLVHDASSIASHSYISQRWMMFARQSQHRFPSEADAEATLIYNYNATYTGNSTSMEFPEQLIYEFNFVF